MTVNEYVVPSFLVILKHGGTVLVYIVNNYIYNMVKEYLFCLLHADNP